MPLFRFSLACPLPPRPRGRDFGAWVPIQTSCFVLAVSHRFDDLLHSRVLRILHLSSERGSLRFLIRALPPPVHAETCSLYGARPSSHSPQRSCPSKCILTDSRAASPRPLPSWSCITCQLSASAMLTSRRYDGCPPDRQSRPFRLHLGGTVSSFAVSRANECCVPRALSFKALLHR